MKVSNLKLNKIFKSEDSRLYLKTAFTFFLVTLVIVSLIGFLFWIVIEMNSKFFVSQGFAGSAEFKLAYLDFVLKFIIEKLVWLLAFSIFIFLIGAYAAALLVRPFKSIASHCQSLRDDSNIVYGSDKLSDFKVLQEFAQVFFKYLRSCTKNESLEAFEMPEEYKKVREFRADKGFVLNFTLFFSVLGLCIMWFFVASANEIQSSTLELALKLLPAYKTEIFFYLKQTETVWDVILTVSFFITATCYFLLARYLYSLVAGASIGYFLTMKSFAKGQYNSRVHLVGFNYIRPYARYFNKYLDHFCRELKINTK